MKLIFVNSSLDLLLKIGSFFFLDVSSFRLRLLSKTLSNLLRFEFICNFQGTCFDWLLPVNRIYNSSLYTRFIVKILSLFKIRQPPIFPYRLQHSIFGRLGLNHRVRDGNGCYPQAYRHRKQFRKESDLSLLCSSAEL